MNASGIVAVVPMKPLHLAKSRLAVRLSPLQRSALSLGMFRKVVQTALESPVDRLWVIGGDGTVKQAASELGAEWHEDEGSDLNESLTRAFQKAFASGLAPMYLPADLPFVIPDDVSELVKASADGQKLTLSPAHRDGGTNAMLVPLGSPFRPALGLNSFQRHKSQAAALGVPLSICDRAGFGLDLDTPEDLKAYEEIEPGLLVRLVNGVKIPL